MKSYTYGKEEFGVSKLLVTGDENVTENKI